MLEQPRGSMVSWHPRIRELWRSFPKVRVFYCSSFHICSCIVGPLSVETAWCVIDPAGMGMHLLDGIVPVPDPQRPHSLLQCPDYILLGSGCSYQSSARGLDQGSRNSPVPVPCFQVWQEGLPGYQVLEDHRVQTRVSGSESTWALEPVVDLSACISCNVNSTVILQGNVFIFSALHDV